MSIRSGQSVTKTFSTRGSSGGVNADSLPTGTLYVNGSANGATVTITNISTGLYKASVTLPTLAIGDLAEIVVSATVSSVTDNGIIWFDTCDLVLNSSGQVTFSNTSIATVTTVTNQLTAAQIATGVWQDATGGDFTVSGSIGKGLFTSGNAPGAASGISLVGSKMDLVDAPNATALGAIATALLDLANGIESGYTLRQIMRLMSSVLLGKGGGGNPYRDVNDTKNRVTYTASGGDRTAVTLNDS